jgi:hypothetical protein
MRFSSGGECYWTNRVELARHDERISRIEKLDDRMTKLDDRLVETQVAIAKMTRPTVQVTNVPRDQ